MVQQWLLKPAEKYDYILKCGNIPVATPILSHLRSWIDGEGKL